MFYPKYMKFTGNDLQFSFFVEPENQPSSVVQHRGSILISINSIEFFLHLDEAINLYKHKLKATEDLQVKFIDAWESIEKGEDIKDCDKIRELS
jgi:hypothetical protein